MAKLDSVQITFNESGLITEFLEYLNGQIVKLAADTNISTVEWHHRNRAYREVADKLLVLTDKYIEIESPKGTEV